MALLFRRGPASGAAVGTDICAAATIAGEPSSRGQRNAITTNGNRTVRAVRAHSAADALTDHASAGNDRGDTAAALTIRADTDEVPATVEIAGPAAAAFPVSP